MNYSIFRIFLFVIIAIITVAIVGLTTFYLVPLLN